MIPNKTFVILFLITIFIKPAASTSPGDTQEPSSSSKPFIRVRMQRPAPGTPINVLVDTTTTVEAVEVVGENTEEVDTFQERSVPSVNTKLEELVNHSSYKELSELVKTMKPDEFLKEVCPFMRTHEQLDAVIDYLKEHKMVASFYLHGDIGIIKEVIIESGIYDGHKHYVDNGDLETALSLAFKENRYDRIIDFLDVRMELTAEMDRQSKRRGQTTSFEWFMSNFFHDFAPWKDSMTLKRFLTLRGDKLRDKHLDILDTLCQTLVYHLKLRTFLPSAKKLLIDFIGQPSLLTHVTFAQGFLLGAKNMDRSDFLECAWNGAVEEGLKQGYRNGGRILWDAMRIVRPTLFFGDHPSTALALDAVLEHFPTKQKLEEEWADKNAVVLFNKIKDLTFILTILPNVFWPLIVGYAISWTDI